jgi:hypothetical protein
MKPQHAPSEDRINLVKITKALSKGRGTPSKGTFARADWRTRDRTIIIPAKLDKAWYGKSEATQRREIEKLCGTYRAGSSPSARVKDTGGRIARPGTLRDKTADAPANSILITAADKEAAAKPQQPSPPLTLSFAASPRRCSQECGKDLPYRARSDANFYCESHSKAFRNRKVQQDILDRAFKDYQQSAHAKAEAVAMLEVYRLAAAQMRDSAARCGLDDATFVATSTNIVAIHDTPLLPPLRALLYGRKETGEDWLRGARQAVDMQVTKGNLTTDHPDVVALLESAAAAIDGPERSVTLYLCVPKTLSELMP